MSDLRPEVARFADELESMLREREAKGWRTWSGMPVEYLARQAREAMHELQIRCYELEHHPAEADRAAIAWFAALVAMYAMMIADNVRLIE